MTPEFAQGLRCLAVFGLLYGWIHFAFWICGMGLTGDFDPLSVIDWIGRDRVMAWAAKAGIPSTSVLLFARMSWFGSALLIFLLPVILVKAAELWFRNPHQNPQRPAQNALLDLPNVHLSQLGKHSPTPGERALTHH